MNKKHLHPILLVALLLSTAQICMAQQRALVLHHADGTTTDVELLKLPRVVFSGDKVVIGTVDNTLLEFAKEVSGAHCVPWRCRRTVRARIYRRR